MQTDDGQKVTTAIETVIKTNIPNINLKYKDHDKTYIDDIQRITENITEGKVNNLNIERKKIGTIQKILMPNVTTKKVNLTEVKQSSFDVLQNNDNFERRTIAIRTTNLINLKQNESFDGQIEDIQKVSIMPVTRKLNVIQFQPRVGGKNADNVDKLTTSTVISQINETENKQKKFHVYTNQADFNYKFKRPLVTPKADMKEIQQNNLDIYKKQTGNVFKVTATNQIYSTEFKQENIYVYRNQADFIAKVNTPLEITKVNMKELHNVKITSIARNVTGNKEINFNIDKGQIDNIEKLTITKTNVTEIIENNIDYKKNQTQTQNSNSFNNAQKVLRQTSSTQYTSPQTHHFEGTISNLANGTQSYGELLKFTDFLQNLIEVIKTFEDRELGNLANTFNREIKKCYYKNCAFDELFSNFENRNYITHKMRKFENIPVTEVRQKLTEFQKQIQSESLESKTRFVIDYINNITYKDSQDKLMTVLNHFKVLSTETNRNASDFENLIKEEMKIVLFDHYSSLDRKVQLGLGKLLNVYVRPIEQNQGRSFKRWHPENNINDSEEDYSDKFDLIEIRRLLEHKIVKRQIIEQNRTAISYTPTDMIAEAGNLYDETKNNNANKIINNFEHKRKPITEVIQHLTLTSPVAKMDMTTIKNKKRRKHKKRRRKRRRRHGKKHATRVGRNGSKAGKKTGKKVESSDFQ